MTEEVHHAVYLLFHCCVKMPHAVFYFSVSQRKYIMQYIYYFTAVLKCHMQYFQYISF